MLCRHFDVLDMTRWWRNWHPILAKPIKVKIDRFTDTGLSLFQAGARRQIIAETSRNRHPTFLSG